MRLKANSVGSEGKFMICVVHYQPLEILFYPEEEEEEVEEEEEEEEERGRLSLKVVTYLPNYTALYARRSWYSYLTAVRTSFLT
jgi:hypothetical protein